MKNLQIPNFIITFLGFIVFVILHNVISALFGFEEAIFFLSALAMLAATPVLIVIWVFKKTRK